MRFVLVAVLILSGLSACSSAPELPACSQDQLIHGWGDFNDGRWERYSCDVSTRDLPTHEQTLDLKKLAECPAVERDPYGRIAMFDDGISEYVMLADGSSNMPLAEFVRACLR
jgi:hypothetical protein